jgi:hypothetical protein
MKLKLTIDIFSGRENPSIIVSGNQAKTLAGKINPSSKLTGKEVLEPFNLGYRGIIVEQLDQKTKELPSMMRLVEGMMYGDKNVNRIDDSEVLNFAKKHLSDVKNVKLPKDFKGILDEQVNRFKYIKDLLIIDKIKWPIDIFSTCQCAPVYEPDWWNNNASIKANNNCYNYACNYRTDTFAQPGRATGNQYSWPGGLDGCTVAAGKKSAKDGAISDALINSPLANNKCPGEGHLVALVIWPGVDFHWYRKGNNAKWSHKPGSTSATNLDNSGNTISDPRTADRGNYTQFCTFMVVKHGHIKIN